MVYIYKDILDTYINCGYIYLGMYMLMYILEHMINTCKLNTRIQILLNGLGIVGWWFVMKNYEVERNEGNLKLGKLGGPNTN